MKKKIIGKALYTLLIFIFLLALASCDRNNNEITYDENQRLEIEKEPIKYSDDFIEKANLRFTKSIVSLTESHLEMQLSDTQKKSISEQFSTTLIPIFYRIRIYEKELDLLLTGIEEYINKDNESGSPLYILYEQCLYTIGSERSGMLVYDLCLKKIEDKAKTAEARYEAYGYSWYLEEADRCNMISSELKDMGEKKFVNALTMTAFIASTASNIRAETNENAFLLTDAELLFILDRQGTLFESQCPSDSEWQTLGALITELIPTRSSDLGTATVYALKNDAYFNSLMRVMPDVFSLYASVAKTLKEDALFSLEGTPEEQNKAILLALVASEAKIRELDTALSTYAKTDSERLRNTVAAYTAPGELEAFKNTYEPISADELIAALKSASENIGQAPEMHSLAVSYFASLSPELAFVLFK